MGGTRSLYGKEESCIQDLVGKPKGKRPFGRPRRGWEYNINIDLQEFGWGHGMD